MSSQVQFNRKIAVIGLGYVGLPVAAAFAEKQCVIAFDINQSRIAELKIGRDHTGEVNAACLQQKNFLFTHDADDLKQADFYIIAVPTPVDQAKQPDFSPLFSASQTIAPHLKVGDIVVYESTVYPGATEEKCVPILEQYSGLKCGIDFFVGYSPERINPGDKDHTFTQIKKVVAGQTPEILEIVAAVYESVVTAGVYKATSIKVAEAAKVIENTQRDLNIAFVNELAMICHELKINTMDVLDAASTKWNFLPFKPGLVGGHCIGVDPYYLTYKAESMGLHPQVILAGRRVNDNMGKYIAEQTIKLLSKSDVALKQAKIGLLGLTFKENCPDLRNTKVVDIIYELNAYGVSILLHDPLVNSEEAKHEYNLKIQSMDEFHNLDALILAVPHQFYLQLPTENLIKMLKPHQKIIIDVKSALNKENFNQQDTLVWCL